MFDLNEQKQRWQNALRRSGVPPESLGELEAHVDDVMVELKEKGLTEEESFLIASRRIGPVDLLGVEYCKERTGGSRGTLVKGMLAFIVFCMIWTAAGLVVQFPLEVQLFPFVAIPLLLGLFRFLRDDFSVLRSSHQARTSKWRRSRMLYGLAIAAIMMAIVMLVPMLVLYYEFALGLEEVVIITAIILASSIILPIIGIGLLRVAGDIQGAVGSARHSGSEIRTE